MMADSDRARALALRRAGLSTEAKAALERRLGRGEAAGASRSACVVPLTDGVGAPFFCVHPAWGDVLAYRALGSHLRRPFIGIQAPGLCGETVPPTVDALAQHYADAVCSIAPEGPYLLGGWSLGGVLAMAMAAALEARGERVALVALIDTEARHAEDDDIDDDAGTFGRLAVLLGPAATPERMARMRLSFDTTRAAVADWTARPVRCPLALFRRTDAPTTRYAGWEDLTQGRIRIEVVGGDHFTMMTEPQVGGLALRLGEALDAALQAQS